VKVLNARMLGPVSPEFIVDGNDPAVADLIEKHREIERAAAGIRSRLDHEVWPGPDEQFLVYPEVERAFQKEIAEPADGYGISATPPLSIVELVETANDVKLAARKHWLVAIKKRGAKSCLHSSVLLSSALFSGSAWKRSSDNVRDRKPRFDNFPITLETIFIANQKINMAASRGWKQKLQE
jgi:hypothetical protein